MAISGGTYVIVQHASYLQGQGYDITLAVQEAFSNQTLDWHDRANLLKCVPIDSVKHEKFDLVIATWWKTALELNNFNSNRYAYFVQSIESRFYPATEIALRELVDSTYHLPVAYVTEAAWIRDYLQETYGHDAALVRNGIRKDLYGTTGHAVTPRDPKKQPRVLIEGHFGVPFKNTALGLRLAIEAGAEDIWLLTGTPVKWLPGVSRIFSRVPMNITPEIYRSCDILVKLSTVEGMFGPPLEIFHCGGTAIVFDVTGHDEYIVDGENACVVRLGDMNGVVTTLRRILNDRTELAKLQAGALKTAESWVSWDESSEEFESWVEKTLNLPIVDRLSVNKCCNEAYSEYEIKEKNTETSISCFIRHRINAVTKYLPPKIIRGLKQLRAISEVLVGPRGIS